MQFTIREAARLFRMPDRELQQLVDDGEVPAQRILGRYRLNRSDLLEWATRVQRPVPPELLGPADADDPPPPSLGEALTTGGIVHGIAGADQTSVFRELVARLPLPPEVDRAVVCDILLAREALGTTAVGNGVAIPHVRNAMVLRVPRAIVMLGFLATPLDFGALDGRPVHALFTLACPTIRSHLQLLARLGAALQDAAFAEAIGRQAPAEAIHAELARLQMAWAAAPAAGGGARR
ncbi:MAG: PTS sugar transporter subunit IIA [Verrucomicrobia bacterium]|nr:PTS sugar transporter subunit IIA [Verrucomicrobiota bacterium]